MCLLQFSFATPIDYCLMLIGVLAAVAQGAALPFAMLLLGDVINTFINNQVITIVVCVCV